MYEVLLADVVTWQNRIVSYGSKPASQFMAHPDNWRVHPQRQRSALKGSLDTLGWVSVVIENRRSGYVVDGHERVWQALKNGDAEVPYILVDLSPEEEAQALLSLDAIAALAQTDAGKVDELLRMVETDNQDVMQFLTDMAKDVGLSYGQPPEEAPEPQIDHAAELQEKWQTELGQLWEIGRHRILCADCLEIENIKRVAGGDMVNMIFADPPYGVDIVATNGYVGGGEAYNIPFGGVKNRRLGTVGGSKPFGSQAVRGTDGASHIVEAGNYAPVIGDDSTNTAISSATMLMNEYPKATHVWWGGNYYANVLPPSSCWLVWNKETTGNFADCELAWTNQARAARLFTHKWNGMLRDSERGRRVHPTQKPSALASWVYETLGNDGDIVLDPFGGSGMSMVAAEQTKRTSRMLELSPAYVAVSLQRMADMGLEPRLIE